MFFDICKAFYKSNHILLSKTLIKQITHMCIVRMLMSWYGNQTKLQNEMFAFQPLHCDGVRQGGLRPHLPAVYLYEPSVQLGSNKTEICDCESATIC